MAIEILSDKAFAVGAKLDHHILKILDVFGRDLEHAPACNGAISGRLHEVVPDVFSNWPLDTSDCEGSNNNLQADIARNPSTSHPLLASRFSRQKQRARSVAASAHEHPISNLERCQLHVLTILDNVDQKVRTKGSVVIELSNVAFWHRVWHQLCAKDKFCCDTALDFSFDGVHAKEVLV